MPCRKKGVVTSVRGETVKVMVTRSVKHKRYEKSIKIKKSYAVHDVEKNCKIDDNVVIEETSPISKTKRWKIYNQVN